MESFIIVKSLSLSLVILFALYFCLKIYFVYYYSHYNSHLVIVCKEYLFHSFTFELFVFESNMSFA